MGNYSPWRHLATLTDVVLDFDDDLPSGHAWWSPAHRVILLAKGLTRPQRRAALAHELVHVELGDCQLDGPDAERIERRRELHAEHVAAVRLIDLDDLMDALAYCMSLDEVAEELDVDRAMLDIRIRLLCTEDRRVIAARFTDDEAC